MKIMEELNRGCLQMPAEVSGTKCNTDTDKENLLGF